MACSMTRTPGVFVCLTEQHSKALRKHVINQLFRMKQSSEEGVYDAGWDALLDSIPKEDKETTPKKDPKMDPKKDLKPTPQKTSALKAGNEVQEGEPPLKKPKKCKKKVSKKKKDDDESPDESTDCMTPEGE